MVGLIFIANRTVGVTHGAQHLQLPFRRGLLFWNIILGQKLLGCMLMAHASKLPSIQGYFAKAVTVVACLAARHRACIKTIW